MRTGFLLPLTKVTEEDRSCLTNRRLFVGLTGQDVDWEVACRGFIVVIAFLNGIILDKRAG